jgi:hypothetical protein
MPGYTGRFFYDGTKNNKITLIPFSPVLVKGTGSILDERGNVYSFGSSAKETTTTYYSSGFGSAQAVTAWMLESMISQNRRDTIKFSYTAQNMSPPEQTGQTTIVEDAASSNGQNCQTSWLNPVITTTTSSGSSFNEQEINEIKYKNGKVVFKMGSPRLDINNHPLSLDSIKVYAYNYGTKTYEIQKSIVFIKGYFDTVDGTQGRLKLNGIQVLDKAGSIVEQYSFNYNTMPLPSQYSYSRDYWGYYNGKMDDPSITNKTLIPRTQVEILTGGQISSITIGANTFGTRDPDSTKMQAGVLTSITYPTGGHTDFTYQTNRYFDEQGSMQLTGGLRVTSISAYDKPTGGTPIVKTYQYNTAAPNFIATSPGYINFGFFVNSQTYRDWEYGIGYTPYNCRQKRVRSYSSESSLNLTPTDGNPVAYTMVTEYTGTPLTNIGKTEYTFNHTTDLLQSASSTGIPIIYDYSFARGQQLSRKDFMRKTDGTYQIVSETNNSYTAFPEVRYDAVGVVVGQRVINVGQLSRAYYPEQSASSDLSSLPAASYAIVSDDNYMTASTTNIYDASDPSKFTTSSVEYKFDNIKHQQVTRTRQVDSRATLKVKVNKYPADYLIGSATSTNNIVLDSMLRNNMQAHVVESWDSVKNTTTSINGVAGGVLRLYSLSKASMNAVVPDQVKQLTLSSPLTNFLVSTVSSGNIAADTRYVTMASFDAYDSKNNLTQYTARNRPPISIKWDYLQTLPIAQISNSSSYSSAYTSFEADATNNWTYPAAGAVYDVTAPSGDKSYKLTGGNITSSATDYNRKYVLSYWSNNGAATVSYNGNITGTPLRTANNWTYYEHILPTSSGPSFLAISGTTSVDELALYPVDAQLSTYTYDVNGLAEQSDTKGMTSRFEYDFAQRLKNVKDWEGNIIKTYGYHNYDMTIGNDAKGPATFTRNNCPFGTTAQSTTYSVPANIYYSSTKASANASATYDLNTNGQIKANRDCGCPITMVTFTLSNATGLIQYQATFSGPNSVVVDFPPNGTTTFQIPMGVYSVSINPAGTFVKTFTLGNRTPVTAHYASFTNVNVSPGSSDLTLSITN